MLLKRVNSPLPLVCHWTKLVPQFPQALRGREEGIHDLLVDLEPYGLDYQLSSVSEDALRICSLVRSPEKHDSGCRLENTSEVDLPLTASAGSPQQLLDDNSTQTVDDEQKRPCRFPSTVSFESDQKVPRYVPNRIADNRLASPMSYMGIVSVGQDSGIRNGRGKEVTGPVYGGVGAVPALVGCRERDESPGFGRGLRGLIVVIVRLPRIASFVPPCTLWMASESMDKDDTRRSARHQETQNAQLRRTLVLDCREAPRRSIQ